MPDFFVTLCDNFGTKSQKKTKFTKFPNLQSKKSPLSLLSAIFATFLITNVISPTNIQAATFPISSSPVGTVITLGGQKFVKINMEGMFVGLQTFQPPLYSGTMQNFTTANCNAIPTPTGSNYTLVGNLVDNRDNKSYEVRKFSDGKCWMVDNLRYGGGTNGTGDYYAGKTTFRNATSLANSTVTTTNGLNPTGGSATLVGDCRDSATGASASLPRHHQLWLLLQLASRNARSKCMAR